MHAHLHIKSRIRIGSCKQHKAGPCRKAFQYSKRLTTTWSNFFLCAGAPDTPSSPSSCAIIPRLFLEYSSNQSCSRNCKLLHLIRRIQLCRQSCDDMLCLLHTLPPQMRDIVILGAAVRGSESLECVADEPPVLSQLQFGVLCGKRCIDPHPTSIG